MLSNQKFFSETSDGKQSQKLFFRIVMPREHGGWSLTLEPVFLGLIVSWSLESVALGTAALVAFMARTPLKVVLVDVWRKRWLPRSHLSLFVASVEIGFIFSIAAFVYENSYTALIWIPLIIAMPLVIIELIYSMKSQSRLLIPELAGTIGISAVVALEILVAKNDLALALSMWAVVCCRAIAAIGYVRVQIRKIHRTDAKVSQSDFAQIAAICVVSITWSFGNIPAISFFIISAIAIFNLIAVRQPAKNARAIGIQQMIFGVSLVLATGLFV